MSNFTNNAIGILGDPVVVAHGGTGRSTLTDGAFLIGDGTNPVELLGPATDGQLAIGVTGGSPILASITEGTNVVVTDGAGSITVAALTGTPVYNYTATSAATYVVAADDNVIAVDCSGAPKQVNLPDAPTTGSTYIIKDVTGSAGGNAITVTTVTGAVNIDGAVTYVMNVNYASATVMWNGTQYMVL
jgi:hypothetical protein